MFSIRIVSEDTFSVEYLKFLLYSESNISEFHINEGNDNYKNIDLLIIILSKKFTCYISEYIIKFKNEITSVKNVIIIGGENCSRIFKDLQIKSTLFRYININNTVENIVSDIDVFICFIIKNKKITANNFFIPIRSRMVINYIVKGYTPQRIAKTMAISTKTISSHKRMAMTKLGVKTTAELIAKYSIIEGFIRSS